MEIGGEDCKGGIKLMSSFLIWKFMAGERTEYSAEDCAFEEEMRPDGYNVYWSKKHHLPVSLSSSRQRQLYKGKGFLPLSHFLPMLSSIPAEPEELQDHLEPNLFPLPLETDSMDPFGIATKLGVVKSPSFHE
ncbi:hypothetical protein CB1_000164019 [Camelus ferus]|nr:hypothetical protein CB1_000164019 [Camelus ferus]